jgi:uncharacterized membrane protein
MQAPLLVLAYFCEGIVRAWSERGLSRGLAIAEITLAMGFVVTASLYARLSSRSTRRE